MESIELQNRYYDKIVENFFSYCEEKDDRDGFKNIINCNLCFEKIDSLIIDDSPVKWCYHSCISYYWTEKLISDLLLAVNIEDLESNKYDLSDGDKYYFENYFDFLTAKENFLNDYFSKNF